MIFLKSIQKNKKHSLYFSLLPCTLLCAALVFSLFYLAGCKAVADTASDAGTLYASDPDSDNSDDVSAYDNSTDISKLIVGTDPTYKPFEFMKDGKINGFDIDIVNEIAERMDRELEIITLKWDGTYNIPEDLNLDMVISAIPISPDKGSIVDFSDSYFTMEYMLVTLIDTEIKIKENLKGKSVGILDIEKGYLTEDYMLDYRIEGYSDITTMENDLKNKNIDGILISLPIGVNLINGDTGLYKVLEVVKSNRDFAIVFREGSLLREEVNDILEEMKEDGAYDKIYDKWFNYNL